MAPKLMKMIRVEAPLLREIMAEFLGTFILVVSPVDSLLSFARKRSALLQDGGKVSFPASSCLSLFCRVCVLSISRTANVTKPPAWDHIG